MKTEITSILMIIFPHRMFRNIIDRQKSSNITQHNCGQQEIRLLGKLTRAELFSVSEARVQITSHMRLILILFKTFIPSTIFMWNLNSVEQQQQPTQNFKDFIGALNYHRIILRDQELKLKTILLPFHFTKTFQWNQKTFNRFWLQNTTKKHKM